MKEVGIVLAGGLGTRIRSLYPELPKPMIPIGGKPFVEWVIEWLKGEGITEVILSVGYRAAQIVEYFEKERVKGVGVRCVKEEQPLGTGGAVRWVVREVHAPWCVVCNGDSLCPASLGELRKVAERENSDVVMLVSEVTDARDYGSVQVNEAGVVTGFIEKGERGGPGLVNAGVYYMRTEWARELAEQVPLSLERDVFPRMQSGRLRAVRTSVPFLDIGVPERLAGAEEFLRRWIAKG